MEILMLNFTRRQFTRRQLLLSGFGLGAIATSLYKNYHATRHSQLLPNCYRVVNLGDTIPLIPPFEVYGNRYSHVGQMWSFLANMGDITRNHVIVTYQTAVTQSIETDKPRSYPVAGF